MQTPYALISIIADRALTLYHPADYWQSPNMRREQPRNFP
jgi:hypothetical protein